MGKMAQSLIQKAFFDISSYLLFLTIIILKCSQISSLYLPGMAPVDYKEGDQILLKVTTMDSVKAQIPVEYYEMGFCGSENTQLLPLSLGEMLTGEKIETSNYELRMLKSEKCKILCMRSYDQQQIENFKEKIQDQYVVNWIVDNLPAVNKNCVKSKGISDIPCKKGYSLGYYDEDLDKYFLHNHVSITLFYHESPAYEDKSALNRIVGIEVEPYSVDHELVDGARINIKTGNLEPGARVESCDYNEAFVSVGLKYATKELSLDDLNEDEIMSIIWTYDVEWEKSDVRWAYRWDIYLKMENPQIHWFSIINSIVLILFLAGLIAAILMRTIRRDLLVYNEKHTLADEVNPINETGWKLVIGDVFRVANGSDTLAVLVGSGVQVLGMLFLSAVFSYAFSSPLNRGGLTTVILLLFAFMGVLSGYVSTRLYKFFGYKDWKKNTLYTSMFFPSVFFGLIFFLNILVLLDERSGAVEMKILFAFLMLWFGISTPLVYVGTFLAMMQGSESEKLKVNDVPRPLPPQKFYNNTYFSILVGGLLPFSAVYIEFYFIMSSIWQHKIFYICGLMIIVFIIMIVICSEVAIVQCYFQLNNEDHHWAWMSFLRPAASSLYIFLHSGIYFFTKLQIDSLIPILLYFGYMYLVSFAIFLATGAIGYLSCLYFVRSIYMSIKSD